MFLSTQNYQVFQFKEYLQNYHIHDYVLTAHTRLQNKYDNHQLQNYKLLQFYRAVPHGISAQHQEYFRYYLQAHILCKDQLHLQILSL